MGDINANIYIVGFTFLLIRENRFRNINETGLQGRNIVIFAELGELTL